MMSQSQPHARARSIEGALLLAALTAIWGSTFVVVKGAVDPGTPGAWPPGTFLCARFWLAAACFLPFFLKRDRRLWLVGLELGVLLFVGYGTQIVGQTYTSVNRSAFITSTYVILVPLLASIAGHPVRPLLWGCCTAALAGVGLLSFDGSPPNVGDLWTVGTAVAYAVYILRLESHSRRYPAPALTGISLLAVALLAIPWVAAEPRPASPPPYVALVYLALICTAVVTWLQTVGQSMVTASQAAVVFTLEPLFASVFGYLFRGETLGPRGWAGAILIFAAAVCSQLPRPAPEEAASDAGGSHADGQSASARESS
jgi:drug/metabolite transporter (DMT)-like permease